MWSCGSRLARVVQSTRRPVDRHAPTCRSARGGWVRGRAGRGAPERPAASRIAPLRARGCRVTSRLFPRGRPGSRCSAPGGPQAGGAGGSVVEQGTALTGDLSARVARHPHHVAHMSRLLRARGCRPVHHPPPDQVLRVAPYRRIPGMSPCQGEGRGFESRRPLGRFPCSTRVLTASSPVLRQGRRVDAAPWVWARSRSAAVIPGSCRAGRSRGVATTRPRPGEAPTAGDLASRASWKADSETPGARRRKTSTAARWLRAAFGTSGSPWSSLRSTEVSSSPQWAFPSVRAAPCTRRPAPRFRVL